MFPQLQDDLTQSADGVIALTADCWTSLATEAYQGITAHWLDRDLVLHKAILGVERLPGAVLQCGTVHVATFPRARV